MRLAFLLVGTLSIAALAGCSGGDEPTVNATAPAGFVPPTALNRTDFLDIVERRFNQLDVNRNMAVDPDEIPERHHDVIASFDANGDGKVSRDEFISGSLARFDQADRNQDEVLTGQERRAALGAATINSDAEADNMTAPPVNASQPIGG